MHHYRYCPVCGGRLRQADVQHGIRFDCTACGRSLWENAKPCAGALIERTGQLLLVRRAVEPFQDYWDIPGGFLEADEHPEAGAVREVREETGLEVRLGECLGMFIDTYGDGDEQIYTLNIYYLAEPTGGAARPADDATALAWFSPDELPKRVAFAHAREVLDTWRRRALSHLP